MYNNIKFVFDLNPSRLIYIYIYIYIYICETYIFCSSRLLL